MADWWEGLNPRRRKFCEIYSQNGGVALAAARDAGYLKPDPEGARLLGDARIREALEKLRESTTNAAILTREERQTFWSETVKSADISMSDRLRASELLGKSQADFIERKEITGKNGAPLNLVVEIVFGK